MNSRHPDPRRVWKGGPQQRVMTPLPGIPLIPRINQACSKKLVLEQHSFTFADFCCPLTHLLGIPAARGACPEKLVLEQRSFTWRLWPKAASSALAVNTGHILVLRRKTCALFRAKTSALLRRKTCAVLRARTCALFRANTKETTKGGGRRPPPPLWR